MWQKCDENGVYKVLIQKGCDRNAVNVLYFEEVRSRVVLVYTLTAE